MLPTTPKQEAKVVHRYSINTFKWTFFYCRKDDHIKIMVTFKWLMLFKAVEISPKLSRFVITCVGQHIFICLTFPPMND